MQLGVEFGFWVGIEDRIRGDESRIWYFREDLERIFMENGCSWAETDYVRESCPSSSTILARVHFESPEVPLASRLEGMLELEGYEDVEITRIEEM